MCPRDTARGQPPEGRESGEQEIGCRSLRVDGAGWPRVLERSWGCR